MCRSAEFKNVNCQTGYYTLGAPVNQSALLLNDLFTGGARMQTSLEAEQLHLTLPSAKNIWDQKLPVIANPAGGYLAFTRVYLDPMFTVSLLSSPDGVSFTEVGQLFPLASGQTFYDAHITVDNSVCPPQYVMSMECAGHEGTASLCTSQSSFPARVETWPLPQIIVDGCAMGQVRAYAGLYLCCDAVGLVG